MRRLAFLFALLVVLVGVGWLDQPGATLDRLVFSGFASGLFGLLGVALGLADATLWKRLGLVLAGMAGLWCIQLLRPHFNGWELLLSTARLVVAGAVFSVFRYSKGFVLSNCRARQATFLTGVSLKYLFGFTAFVALFLAFIRFLKDYQGPRNVVVLIIGVLTVGIFAASVPLLAAYAAMGRHRAAAGVLFALATAMLAACTGMFAYSQTGSLQTGLQWSINSVVEAMTVAGVLLVLRGYGYCLTPVADAELKRRAASVKRSGTGLTIDD